MRTSPRVGQVSSPVVVLVLVLLAFLFDVAHGLRLACVCAWLAETLGPPQSWDRTDLLLHFMFIMCRLHSVNIDSTSELSIYRPKAA